MNLFDVKGQEFWKKCKIKNNLRYNNSRYFHFGNNFCCCTLLENVCLRTPYALDFKMKTFYPKILSKTWLTFGNTLYKSITKYLRISVAMENTFWTIWWPVRNIPCELRRKIKSLRKQNSTQNQLNYQEKSKNFWEKNGIFGGPKSFTHAYKITTYFEGKNYFRKNLPKNCRVGKIRIGTNCQAARFS